MIPPVLRRLEADEETCVVFVNDIDDSYIEAQLYYMHLVKSILEACKSFVMVLHVNLWYCDADKWHSLNTHLTRTFNSEALQ